MGEGGVDGCGKAQNCVEVCPKEIPLVDSIAVGGPRHDEAHAARLAPRLRTRTPSTPEGVARLVAPSLAAPDSPVEEQGGGHAPCRPTATTSPRRERTSLSSSIACATPSQLAALRVAARPRDVWARTAGPHVLLGLRGHEAFARLTPLGRRAPTAWRSAPSRRGTTPRERLGAAAARRRARRRHRARARRASTPSPSSDPRCDSVVDVRTSRTTTRRARVQRAVAVALAAAQARAQREHAQPHADARAPTRRSTSRRRRPRARRREVRHHPARRRPPRRRRRAPAARASCSSRRRACSASRASSATSRRPRYWLHDAARVRDLRLAHGLRRRRARASPTPATRRTSRTPSPSPSSASAAACAPRFTRPSGSPSSCRASGARSTAMRAARHASRSSATATPRGSTASVGGRARRRVVPDRPPPRADGAGRRCGTRWASRRCVGGVGSPAHVGCGAAVFGTRSEARAREGR